MKNGADLRNKFHNVRLQGERAVCMACAATALHEYARVAVEEYSVEHLFQHATLFGASEEEGVSFDQLIQALQDKGQGLERECPLAPMGGTDAKNLDASIFRRARLEGSCTDAEGIAQHLRGGRPVILGLVITDGFRSPDPLGRIFRVSDDPERSRHAVLAVGFDRDKDGLFILVRNSWGGTWGIGGHAWVHEYYINDQIEEIAVLRDLIE